MSFKFGPQTKTDVKVGYIDPVLGYVSGVTVCEANTYAKNYPGTTFIFTDGDNNIKYLNINEVNELDENDIVSSTDECGGLQTYKECTSPEVVFYGGGGVGASGNPIIGVDGSLLAVDLVSGGFGYQYPPLVQAVDKCQIGNGAVIRSVLGTVADTVEAGLPFETYEECSGDAIEYGRIYDQDGQDVGEWDPAKYLPREGEDPILLEIIKFQESLKNPWWTTREDKPLSISSQNETFSSNDVTYPVWSDFLNKYAISPIAPSDVAGSDNAGKTFTFEWQEDFPTTGEYIFRVACDNVGQLYLDNVFVADVSLQQNQKVITKQIQEGIHKIRFDLVNSPIYEIVTVTETPGTAFFIKKDGEIYLDLTSFPKSAVNVTFSTYAISDGGVGRDHTIEFAELIFKDIKDVANDGGTYGVPGGVLHGPIVQTGGDRLAIVEGRAKEVDKGIEIVAYTGDNIAGGKDDFFVAIAGAVLVEQPQPESQSEIIQGILQEIVTPVTQVVSVESDLKPKFILQGSDAYLQVDGDGTGEIEFEMTVDDNPYFAGIAAEKVIIPADGGSVTLERDRFIEIDSDNESGKFTSGKKYGPIQIIGAGVDAKGPVINDEKRLGLRDADGNDENIKIKIKNIIPDIIATTSTTSTTTSVRQEKVQSSLSWNQNPMGLAMVIEQPPIPIPKEEIPATTGPCPPNPIWTTRFPSSSQQWYPVNHPSWADFFNRYAISPIPPLETPGSDGTGVVYTNYWDVEMPFRGIYEFQVQRDNTARIYVDGNLAFDIKTSGDAQWVESGLVNKVKSQQVFLESGRHRISVEVENTAKTANSTINQKVFSTKDWKNVEGGVVESVDVSFTVENETKNQSLSFTFTAEDGSDSFTFLSPTNGSYTEVKTIKVGKKYKVVSGGNTTLEQGLVSGSSETQDPSNKIFADVIDSANDNNDLTVQVSGGVFTSSNKRSISDSRDTFDITFEVSVSDAPLVDAVVETRNGITYSGPPLFGYSHTTGGPDGTGWGDFMNEYSVSPKTFREINQPDNAIDGVFVLIWRDVFFPETGTYLVKLAADNEAVLKSDGVEIARSSDFLSDQPSTINVNFSVGTHDIVVELQNFDDGINIFETNPMGVSLLIEKQIVLSVENTAASWVENPMGISAILVPPPCVLKTGGTGVVVDVIVEDPGNGYIAPAPNADGYPVLLELSEVIVENPGINYSAEDQIQIVPDLGANPTYTSDSFGRIQSVQVTPTAGYTSYPSITIPSTTGVNASFRPVFRVVRDPLPQPEEIIQVTDLVGLKQTGYVDGRAYYGAVYYENGVRFAGYYKTIGTPIRVYDTLQESITGEVTTVPSAIQRSGTDITSNDPTLNIPGTPQDLV